MNRLQHEKLKWKCRRGLLELDIVLERFLRDAAPREQELEALHALLDLPDNDLWEIVAGRSEDYPAHLKPVVARLRSA
jgi:antitoxin CptB